MPTLDVITMQKSIVHHSGVISVTYPFIGADTRSVLLCLLAGRFVSFVLLCTKNVFVITLPVDYTFGTFM